MANFEAMLRQSGVHLKDDIGRNPTGRMRKQRSIGRASWSLGLGLVLVGNGLRPSYTEGTAECAPLRPAAPAACPQYVFAPGAFDQRPPVPLSAVAAAV